MSFGRAGVSEGGSTTSVEVDQDLQPATRFYWRARWVQGSTSGDWSSTFTFRTQVIGYNRPGELYDPLVNGASVAEALTAGATFVAGKGLRLPDTNAYARYRLAQPIWTGEFSVDVEGISNNPVSSTGNTGKLKILSMDDNPSNHYTSDYLFNLQYRGFNGNPDHAISFKVLMGEDVEERKLEPALSDSDPQASACSTRPTLTTGRRPTATSSGSPCRTAESAASTAAGSPGAGGATIYDNGQSSPFSYQPSPHFAYLGVNNNVEDTGSWPATYRNVWIGNKPRPTTLGSALAPR